MVKNRSIAGILFPVPKAIKDSNHKEAKFVTGQLLYDSGEHETKVYIGLNLLSIPRSLIAILGDERLELLRPARAIWVVDRPGALPVQTIYPM